MKHTKQYFTAAFLAWALGACTTRQQQRLLAATEAAALTALEYRARGASSKLAATGGVLAGLHAFKNPPAQPVPAAIAETTSSK